jgi:DNA polymerase-3 subunit delta
LLKELDYLTAIKQAEAGTVFPLYLLQGSSFFLKDRLIKTLRGTFLLPDGEFCLHDATEGKNWQEQDSFCLFASRRITLIKNLQDLKPSLRKEFFLALPPPCPREVLLLECEDDSGEEAAELEGAVVKEPVLDQRQLEGFIRRSFAARGLKANAGVCEWLLLHTDRTLEGLAHEIEKISLYIGDGGELSPASATEAVFPYEEGAVFELVEAVVAQDCRRAMRVLSSLSAKDREATGRILALMFRQFRMAYQLAEWGEVRRTDYYRLAQKIGEHPFAVKKYLELPHRLSRSQALAGLEQLSRIDQQVKRAGMDPQLLLEAFIVSTAVRPAIKTNGA